MGVDVLLTGLGAGVTSALIAAVTLILRRSFAGIATQWQEIFATQRDEIADLRKELSAVREQAARDRLQFHTELFALRTRLEEEVRHERSQTAALREENRRLYAEMVTLRMAREGGDA